MWPRQSTKQQQLTTSKQKLVPIKTTLSRPSVCCADYYWNWVLSFVTTKRYSGITPTKTTTCTGDTKKSVYSRSQFSLKAGTGGCNAKAEITIKLRITRNYIIGGNCTASQCCKYHTNHSTRHCKLIRQEDDGDGCNDMAEASNDYDVASWYIPIR